MKHDSSPLKPLLLAIVAALAAGAAAPSLAAGSDPRAPAAANIGFVPMPGTSTASAPTTGAGTTPSTSTSAGAPSTTGANAGTTSTGTTSTSTTGTTSEGQSSTTSTTTLSSGQMRVAGRVAAPFATFAGSSDNAVALATALRTGTPATLSTTSTDAAGVTTVTTTSITPPTKPMGWGNVSHSLALAQFALTKAGVASPTSADLQAALLGGTVTGKDGATVTLAGVLQQRADGMGWGKIAQSYGTTMGAVNHALHASAKTTVTPASTGTATGSSGVVTADGSAAPQRSQGVRTGADAGAKGLTTAAGTAPQRASGVTTAAGATGSGASGIVTASGGNGNGNAFGRGIVTASGDSVGASNGALNRGGGGRGVVTAAGGGGADVVSGKGAGNGNANGHGNGKGKNGG